MEITDFIKIPNSSIHRRKFGETHFVQHKETGQKGVLKLLLKQGLPPTLFERLKQEASRSFDAPGLPKTLCTFENNSYFSFVKTYQEGIPWKKYTDSLNNKDFYRHLPKAVSKIIELLHEVHTKGIVHGDIKPSNILINASSPDDFQMALIDFGMSFPLGYKSTEKQLFSLGFSAPELLLSQQQIANETTDFYSLGISIYNLITSEIPLAHPNPELFINLQLTHPLPESSKIPASVYSLLANMTYKELFALPPNQLSAEEVVKTLKKGIDGRMNYDTLLTHWNKIEIKKKWFKYR